MKDSGNADSVLAHADATRKSPASVLDPTTRTCPVGEVGDERALPEIVCLCGSTRFMAAFQKANIDLTLAGKIVLSIGCNTESDDCLGIAPDAKAALDELHKRKIDLADRVLVLNVGGYIGSSTRSEIEYATAHGKPVDYLEPRPAPVDGGSAKCPTCGEAQRDGGLCGCHNPWHTTPTKEEA